MSKEGFARQKILLRETASYLIRDFKYIYNAIGQWVIVFNTNFELGDKFRSTYYFFRHVDDVLDCDRKVNQDPIHYANTMINAIEKEKFDFEIYPILKLAKISLEYLELVKKPGDQPKKLMIDVIKGMMTDNLRLRSGIALKQETLFEEYRKQFYPMHNLQLICIGSEIRFREKIDIFPLLQARIQGLSDLEKDWGKHLINIPLEVLETAQIKPRSAAYEDIIKSPEIRVWIYQEALDCQKQLKRVKEDLATQLAGQNEHYSRIIYWGLIKGLERSLRKIIRDFKGE